MGNKKNARKENKLTNQRINNSTSQQYHTAVLLKESIDALQIKPNGIYVDCTFGGGGHSKAILEKLDGNGKLIAFDQDSDAKKNLPEDDRMIFIPNNFKHLQRFLKLHQLQLVDGILADLGVSSHQFDEAKRGFSIRFDAPLDMRMDQREGITAANVLQNFSEHQLHKMFEQYGEVTNAKTLASTIVKERLVTTIKTVNEFKQTVRNIVKGNPQKYFAQVFQALRIQVNDELGALKELLQQSVAVLKPKGRIAIITFHSLEDRVVKSFFKIGSFDEGIVDDVYGKKATNPFNIITKKPIIPSKEEQQKNSRSRSAKLRVVEKK